MLIAVYQSAAHNSALQSSPNYPLVLNPQMTNDTSSVKETKLASTHPDSVDSIDETQSVSSVNENAVLRKIDLHVIPWLALLYLLNFLDRSSIGNAKVTGSALMIVNSLILILPNGN